MPVNTVAIDPKTNTALHVEREWTRTDAILGNEVIPVHLRSQAAHGTFKTVKFTTAGTQTVITPNNDGSLFITDIALFGDKVNGGSLELLFTDGTDTATLALATTTDAPVNYGQGFQGRFQGWKDARIDLIITGNINGSVVVGYMKMPKGLPYSEWDALR